ncbi:MAG: PHP domain-containing protein [Candidatus Thorarchaeota archaeon]
MNLRSFIKKNKFFTFISIVFFIWCIFLIGLSIFGRRTVIFYDALRQVDVSSNYKSKLPLLRYFIEPFYTIGYVFEYKFTWMFLVLIFYPILRGIYLGLKKIGFFRSKKFKIISSLLGEIVSFSFKIISLAILIVGIFILIGFIIQGYFFVSRYFMVPLQLAVRISIALIFIKIVYICIKLFHPKQMINLFKKSFSQKNSKSKVIKQEIVIFLGVGFLLLSTNIILISTPFPPHKITPIMPLDDNEFLFDFQVHTTYSDGWITVEERIKWYMQQGISGAAFSDHDNLRGAKSAQKYVQDHELDFIVFIAEEWTDNANEIHMNIFGLLEEIVPLQSYTPDGPIAMNVSDTISYVKANGGYVTVNHYNYVPNANGGYGVPYSLDQLRDWGVDGFEIVGGGSYGGKYQQIRDYCLSNNLTCVGGSDIHTAEDLNTFIKLKLDDPTNLTITNIFETLKDNTHEIIAINLNPEIVDFPGDLNDIGFYVLKDYVNYILNIDVFQALSWIIWSGLIYVTFYFFGYREIKRVDIKHHKHKIY